MHPTEAQIQRTAAEFVTWALREDAIAFHVPNVRADAVVSKILAGQGVVGGAPDWVIFAPDRVGGVETAGGGKDYSPTTVGRAYCVELKSAKGRQSLKQREFEAACKRAAVPYVICRSIEEFEARLRAWNLLRPGVHLAW